MTRGKQTGNKKSKVAPKTRCRRRHVETPDTLRAALDRIGAMLSQDYGADLWAVLTALRGPDSYDNSVKYATTAVIRDAAFPKRETVNGSVFRQDTPAFAAKRRRLFEPSGGESFHFKNHVEEAFEALGLRWFEYNKPGGKS